MVTKPPIHVVIWLPETFYAAVAATLAEIFQLVNTLRREAVFSFEFVSRRGCTPAASGVSFAARETPSRTPDVLILLAVPGMERSALLADLDAESSLAAPFIAHARQAGAIIAAHCSASYFLAQAGVLDGKAATVSWWLKDDVGRLFPKVRWDASRLLVRDGRLYTCGGGFSGLELAKALLKDLGFQDEERWVRKLLVLPPSRHLQTPYEIDLAEFAPQAASLRERLDALPLDDIASLDLTALASRLTLTPRTMARRFADEIGFSPGQWLKDRRLAIARTLLEETDMSVAEVCHRVGYEDEASFNRLFSKTMGMPPGAYRRESR
ncbi:transcriptional regulator containing an amidase domain and an AraC-type DNA-binding HTH domain [Caulobacter sp. AP07]|uniref:GlxA family transcriptional regulator n=1 Tax=Caulobacter sp. AP07 TaxID=1144304 RepID=UPI000271F2B9|nr:helix-turn-helix domain-containing protein [Caulobacter sp. AP07]EJL30675.1 transcriptional regulator containing an amidase domain and an AraC-type DNA-binding HTH domain [Caulobacter sp. AP07]